MCLKRQSLAFDIFSMTSTLINPPGHSRCQELDKERHSTSKIPSSLGDTDDVGETEADDTRGEGGEAEGGKEGSTVGGLGRRQCAPIWA